MSNPYGYIQVGGVKLWYCEHCKQENEKGTRCRVCGKTMRQKK